MRTTTAASLAVGARIYPAAHQGFYDAWIVLGKRRLENGVIRVSFADERDPAMIATDDWMPRKKVVLADMAAPK